MSKSRNGSRTEYETDRPDETGNEQTEEESAEVEPEIKYLPTLPTKIKSMRGTSFSVESEEPPDLIESLGNALEITDYKTNMAAFWFLDTLALHVLRQKQKLDDYYLSVLISWLAGEMTLIRDRKLSREEFLEEMKNIFKTVAIRVSEENRVPYWDEIVRDNGTEATEYSADNLLPAQMESNQQVSTKNLQKKQPKESPGNAKGEVNKKETFSEGYEDASLSMSEETNKSFSNVDPVVALDIVIESTYNMYANEFRYSLVYAVYVEPIEVETRQLPFSLEKPRSVKLVDPNSMPFNVQLKKMFATMKQTKKKATVAGRGKKKGSKVPETPPPSLTEEEELIRKRQFILPLIEAENALEVIEKHKDEA